MCTTCGCSDNAHAAITDPATGKTVRIENPDQGNGHRHHHHPHHPHDHNHDRDHDSEHEHGHDDGHSHPHSHSSHQHGTTVTLEKEILAKNNQLAERNRGWFEGRNILAFNLVSSPGSGKTTLLERTLQDLAGELPIHVIEGDQESTQDAQRLRETGCKVVQINTGTGCHLDALMIARGLKELQPPLDSVVMIENVGNLVCPALFDLGEYCKVVIVSVTEGEDKPIKYPHMFRASRVMILNKIDLLPYVTFNPGRCIEYARRVNPEIEVYQMSATTGEGMNPWYQWLKSRVRSGAVAVE